ncbi:MAG TPA: hypothetical protein VGC97_00785 [Pyrinomonadaceae bacterium]|jgi:hypothetical protein
MKLAKLAFLVTLLMLALMTSMSAQTLRSEKDPRNIAPTVGTGGTVGGPTGLFTVYDGQTLRKGEWTLSVAYSNFDRDPGNVDITEVPLSFQIGLNDYLELFFTTDGFRALKVNSPRNLSSFYLPNSQLRINGALRSGPAIIQAPQGAGTSQVPGFAIFRPTGSQPFVPFPFIGGPAGNFQFNFPSGPIFGFPAGTFPTLGAPQGTGASANFPGMGSVYGSILPGVVLATTTLAPTGPSPEVPTVFTIAPTYLPDAPFINRTYGTSSFGSFSAGAKWRWTKPNNPLGIGLVGYYQWYPDAGVVPFTSNSFDASGFNQLQRGASPGGSRGDIALVLFADARVRKWMNISANLGYKYTSRVKADFPSGSFSILDRPDEVISAFAVDFPVNKFFQPILEFRSLQYVGGRTPNAFENSPFDGLAGVRIFPFRWMSLGLAYRYNFNQQDADSLNDNDFTGTVTVSGRGNSIVTNISGVPNGFVPSTDPHGFIFQFTAGRRNSRKGDIIRPFANVNTLTVSNREIVIPCPPGQVSDQPCPEGSTVTVATGASSTDPTDVLTYSYTVSGGRVVGSGANVTWDLSGVRPGTYTITAGVDNGCGVCGTTKTETITVRDCVGCRTPCECPTTFDVSGGGVVNPGDTMTFTATVSGGTANDITYNWTVSAGTIVSGQGTPSITVGGTEALEGQNITATVEIGGSLCENCPRTQQETGSVTTRPRARLIDEFGKLPDDEVKARIDALYIELGNDPQARGYIINYGTDKEIANRERQIQKAIAFKKYDPTRVTIVRGGAAAPNGQPGVWTRVYVVPAGADNPQP